MRVVAVIELNAHQGVSTQCCVLAFVCHGISLSLSPLPACARTQHAGYPPLSVWLTSKRGKHVTHLKATLMQLTADWQHA